MLGNVFLNGRTFHFTKHSTNSHIFLYDHFTPCFNFYPTHQVILIRRFQQEESLPSKRRILKKKVKRKGKEQGSNIKDVKLHLPIQGHEKLHEIKRMRNSRQVGDTFLKEKRKWRSHFPIVQNPIYGPNHTHVSFSFALSSNP
jgi:hypothetical protein